MKRFTLLVSFFVLLFISCSLDEAPFEHRYVINLVLKPDMKFQRAFVLEVTFRCRTIRGRNYRHLAT